MIQLDDSNTWLTPKGDLVIDFHPDFDVKLRYTFAEDGLRIFRWLDKNSSKWEEGMWDYGVRFFTEENSAQSSEAIKKFVSAMPEDLRSRVHMFTIYQMTVIQWVSQDYHMYDLLVSNPVLFWIFIYKANTCYWSQCQIQSLIAQKQRKILHRVTGVDSNSAVAFIRKILLGQGERQKFFILNWAVNQPVCIQAIRHLTRVPFPVLYQLYKSPELFNTDMLPLVLQTLTEEHCYSNTDINENKTRRIRSLCDVMFNEYHITNNFEQVERIKQLWKDSERLGRTLQLHNVNKLLSKIQSVTKLQQLHDRWTSRLTRLNCPCLLLKAITGYNRYER